MLAIDNKKFIQEYFDAISGKDKPHHILHKFVKDPSLIEHINRFEKAFPKYEIIPEDIISEGDKIVVRARCSGIHKGEFNRIIPTNKGVNVEFAVIYRIKDDKIVHYWMYFDRMALIEQLGVSPGSHN